MMRFLGLALVGAVTIVLLREFGFRGAPIAASLVLLSLTGVLFGDGYAALSSGFSLPGELSEEIAVSLKLIGVGFLSGVTDDVLSEMGEARIGRLTTLFCRLEMFVLVTPYLARIFDTGLRLLT